MVGFAYYEECFENKEESFIRDFGKDALSERFMTTSDNLISELNSAISKRSEEYHRLADSYKIASDYPDRYSSYYFRILYDSTNICVCFRFSHINRRHAMAPDGWAMMGTRKTVWIDLLD